MKEKERYELLESEKNYIEIFDSLSDMWITEDNICERLNDYHKKAEELRKENQQLKQSQKQLAIEELKLALDSFKNRPTYFDVARQELCLSDQDKQFIDFIDNQIKSLRGEE